MAATTTGYDLFASQISPEGAVAQVEYAEKAAANSGTAVAARGEDGVVFAVEKLTPCKLYESSAGRRLHSADDHMGVAVAGLLADATQLAEIAKNECADYRDSFGHKIPTRELADRLGSTLHAYTLYSFTRPFGAILLIGSYDECDGASLYRVDPSGRSLGYFGVAAGRYEAAARTVLGKLNPAKKKCSELVKELARLIYEMRMLDATPKSFQLELSWITKDTGGKHERVPPEVFAEAERHAQQVVAEMDAANVEESDD